MQTAVDVLKSDSVTRKTYLQSIEKALMSPCDIPSWFCELTNTCQSKISSILVKLCIILSPNRRGLSTLDVPAPQASRLAVNYSEFTITLKKGTSYKKAGKYTKWERCLQPREYPILSYLHILK